MGRVGVIGGGAYGTAMACVLHRAGHETTVWAREPFTVAAINRDRMNPLYLPRVKLPDRIRATGDLAEAIRGMDFVLLAVPAQYLRSVAAEMAPHVPHAMPVVNCAKGIERGTCAFMPEVIAQTIPQATVAVLSGPAFAREIAGDLPTGVTFACADAAVGERVSRAIASANFCTYLTDDVPGSTVGGVMKNVLAIACGIAHGRKLGANARATLITRGLAEMARLGLAKGARLETFLGLSGIGDLTLTCNNVQSRNMSLGVALGEGRALSDVLSERREVTEGASSAEALASLARQLQLRMPIVAAVDAVLNHGADIDASIAQLIAHPWHHEGVAFP